MTWGNDVEAVGTLRLLLLLRAPLLSVPRSTWLQVCGWGRGGGFGGPSHTVRDVGYGEAVGRGAVGGCVGAMPDALRVESLELLAQGWSTTTGPERFQHGDYEVSLRRGKG